MPCTLVWAFFVQLFLAHLFGFVWEFFQGVGGVELNFDNFVTGCSFMCCAADPVEAVTMVMTAVKMGTILQFFRVYAWADWALYILKIPCPPFSGRMPNGQ